MANSEIETTHAPEAASAQNVRGSGQSAKLVASQEKAQKAWSRLGAHIGSITPGGLIRFLMAVGAIIGVSWLFGSSLNSIAPFLIGLLLAYATMPIVDGLDKVVPRSFAVILVVLGEILLIALFFALLIPSVADQVTRLVQNMPSNEELQQALLKLEADLRDTLPMPAQLFIRDWLQQTYNQIHSNLPGFVGETLANIAQVVLGIFGTITFTLSLLVLPTWLFSVLNDKNRGKTFINSILPNSIKTDFWALVSIVDRVLGTYVRGRILSAFFVGLATYAGLYVLEWFGLPSVQSPMLVAMVVGIAELIPTFGSIIGAIPALLVGLFNSWETALGVLVIIIIVQIAQSKLIAPITEDKHIDMNPALLAVALVAASQFGLLALLLAAPLVVIVRDLFRYVYGRFGDPPRPAGVLPGETSLESSQPANSTPIARRAAVAAIVPGTLLSLAYRGRAVRPSTGKDAQST